MGVINKYVNLPNVTFEIDIGKVVDKLGYWVEVSWRSQRGAGVGAKMFHPEMLHKLK